MPTKPTEKKPSQGPLKELSVGRRDVRLLKLTDCVIIPDFNPRKLITRERIDELKAQLKAAAGDDPDSNGQKEPARGHMLPSGKFGFTTGNTRFTALSELAVDDKRFGVILVSPEPKGYTEEQREIDHIISNDGAPLQMNEQGTVYRRLRDNHQLTVKDIAAKTGKTEQHIYDCLALVDTAPEVQQAMAQGQIAPSTVVNIIHDNKPEEVSKTVAAAITTAVAAGKTKATARHVPKGSRQKKTKAKKPTDDLTAAKTDLEKREDRERMERVANFQADSTGKLQDLLNATIPSRCITDRRQTIMWAIDYLKGTKELPQMIEFLAGDEPVINY